MQLNVLDQYCRITGIQPLPGEDRVSLINRIISALGSDYAAIDEELLYNHETLAEDNLIARWLLNNRDGVSLTLDLSEIGQFTTPQSDRTNFILANPTMNKGGVLRRIGELEVDGLSGPEIVTKLRDEEFSLNEVMSNIKRAGYLCVWTEKGNRAVLNSVLPVLLVSIQKKNKSWWQIWKTETANLNLEEVLWEIPLNIARARNLRYGTIIDTAK